MKCEFQVIDPMVSKGGKLAEYAQWALAHNLAIKNDGHDGSAYVVEIEGEREDIVEWITIFYDTGEDPDEIIDYSEIE